MDKIFWRLVKCENAPFDVKDGEGGTITVPEGEGFRELSSVELTEEEIELI
jgi:hypothetical protein